MPATTDETNGELLPQAKEALNKPVFLPLKDLHFDMANPRYGRTAAEGTEEKDALNLIIDSFGAEDLLSSIAVNGFFASEPLICHRENAGAEIKVIEGNRRLAACLIIAKDPRAEGQAKRVDRYSSMHQKHGAKQIDPVPVLLYEGPEAMQSLLPYLGVRHIVGFSPWDSYAKANWIARVVEERQMSIQDIVYMIGDEHGTALRMLQGFYFMEQVTASGKYDPKNSWRKGRGSNPEFPFSWVYTALDYSPIRTWLGIKGDGPKKNPVPPDHLDEAATFLQFLFGDKSSAKKPVISDAREIGDLAQAIGDAEQLIALKNGSDVAVVREQKLPTREQLAKALYNAQSNLEKALALIGQGKVIRDDAAHTIALSNQVKSLAKKVSDDLKAITEGTPDED